MPIATKAPYASAIYASGDLDGPEIGTLVVVVDKGRNLPNRRTMGKQDPYFNARLGKEAKKTNADKRGGQTPKWDQELRFTVHDSSDYYTMKVSLFDEGKRTELIGDAWVDLKGVILPGGGEAEIWQELKCKGKYAGDVRLELTYYDSRPKMEKPTPKKQPSRVFDEGNSPAGSARGRNGVKRRPLPSNPGSSDQPRSYASGPREYGSGTQPRSGDVTPASHPRTMYNNNMPQPVQPNNRLIQHQSSYSENGDYDPFTQHSSQDGQYGFEDPTGYEYNEHDQDGNWNQRHPSHESGYSVSEHEDVHSPANFLPQLPPMNSGRDSSSGRNSRSRQNYDQPQRYASNEEQYRSNSASGWLAQQRGVSDDHLSQRGGIEEHQDQYVDPRLIMSNNYGHDTYQHDSQYDVQDEYDHHNQYEDEAPPPPPMHRASVSNEAVQNHRSSSALSNLGNAESYQHTRQGSIYSESPRTSLSRGPGESQSRSELSLFDYDGGYDPGHNQTDGSAFGSRHELSVQSHRSLSEEPMQMYGSDQASPHSQYFRSPQSSPVRHDMSLTPRSTGSFSQDMYNCSPRDRRDPHHSNSLPDSHSRMIQRQSQPSTPFSPGNQSPLASSPQYPYHSRNGSVSQSHNPSPIRPHPLSQQQDLMSSSPHAYGQEQSTFRSSYDPGMPLIKPLAIAPRKSQPTTPSSVDRSSRNQNRTSIPRKSVSPHPASVDSKQRFSAYSPESFNILNPTSSPTKQRAAEPSGPIVDFHGNVIDPSDRLPETSWAPEPTKPSPKMSDDHLPSSTWAPEPQQNRHRSAEPRRITVRTRDVPRGSRSGENAAYSPSPVSNARPTPDNRASMYMKSPQSIESPTTSSPSTTPHTRNRLRKLNRPHSMVAMSTSTPMHQMQHSWSPPVPAKIPFTDDSSMVPYQGSSNMDRLNFELSNIDIGRNGDARRIGGRRLLEYGS